VAGESSERGFRFPWHVGIGLASTPFENLDDAVRSPVEVVARAAGRSVRQLRALECEHERAVDALGVEDV